MPTVDSAWIDVVDVGHGSCVVIRNGESVVVVDTGPGGAILEYLRQQSIDHIDAVILSHADADHIGGLSAILSQPIPVGRIIWNGDALKSSTLWLDLVYQLADLHRQGVVSATENATEGMTVAAGSDDITVRILAPGVALQHLPPGSRDRSGRQVTSNSASVVAQVIVGGQPVLLIPGDLDELGLAHLDEAGLRPDLGTRFLLLPHHGGRCGSEAATRSMTAFLMSAVSPEAILVSNGRRRFGNPRQDVLDTIREVAPTIKISCTQLAESCSRLATAHADADPSYSAGWLRGYSCAGTMRIFIDPEMNTHMNHHRHDEFLTASVPAHRC